MRSRVMAVTVAVVVLIAASAGADEWPTSTIATDIKTDIDMVPIPGGCFRMGSDAPDAAPDESPVHEVCVKPFSIGKFPVTQGQWIQSTGKNPSAHDKCGADCPVENVSWNDIGQFLLRLNARKHRNYRLPTEAEWEYAARAGGKTSRWAGTDDEKELSQYAWHLANSRYQTHPVGKLKPNAWGLYDMTGNVWEWVSDGYAADAYASTAKDDPQGAEAGQRVLRGGYWGDMPVFARVTRRIHLAPDVKAPGYGLRVVLPGE